MATEPDFRCSTASLVDHEPLAGTAPTEPAYLLVEHPGPWGPHAVADCEFPDEVKAHLASEPDVRVQLIRRHGRRGLSGARRTVYAAWLGAPGPWIGVGSVASPEELLSLDLAALARGERLGLDAHRGELWLVCTNGRRDRCCAERGRPIAAALRTQWPEETWETTHLGGHRFAGTLLALPAGITLGRLDPASAVAAVREVAAGAHPVGHSRGRAGVPAPVQVAELALRTEGACEVHWVSPVEQLAADRVRVTLTDGRGGTHSLELEQHLGPARRQSCASLRTKPTREWVVRSPIGSGRPLD